MISHFKKNRCALAVAALLAAAALHAPGGSAPDEFIVAYLRRGDVVVAASETTFYRGTPAGKTLRKINTPGPMVVDGKFAEQSPQSPLIAYYYPRGGRLLLTRDGGMTWEKITSGQHFNLLHILPDGTFLGTVPLPSIADTPALNMLAFNGEFAVLSHDMGATWQEAGAPFPRDIEIEQFFQEPGAPGVVYALGTRRPAGTPAVCLAGVGKWDWKEMPRAETAELLARRREGEFGWHYGGGKNNSLIRATPENFFALPFLKMNGDLNLYAMHIETAQTAYTFRKGGPKTIPVQVVLTPCDNLPCSTFFDSGNACAFWGLGVQGPGEAARLIEPFSKDETTSSSISDYYVDEEKRLAAAKADYANAHKVEVDALHPYQRDIDLAAFRDFSKPGVYKIQFYHCERMAPGGGETFGGQLIEVTITE